MGVKPAITKTPARTTTQWTVGNPELRQDVTSAATLPNIGSLKDNPNTTTVVGADIAEGTQAIPALASGASYAIAIKIPFNQLPTPVVVGISDYATFVVAVTALSHGIAGLVLGEFNIGSIAYTLGSIAPSYKNELQLNQTYTGWGALVSGTLVAVSATAAGTLTARVTGTIYDLLG
jgi:hypothetical protein